jgi:hypothetical protein
MRVKNRCLLVLLIFISCSTRAQTNTGEAVSGSSMATSIPGIYGYVKDSINSQLLENATITLNGINFTPIVLSDSLGIYFFQQIPAGSVVLKGNAPTFANQKHSFIFNGHLKFLDFSLLHSIMLAGQLSYQNQSVSPLDNVVVYLKDNNTGEVVDSTTTNFSGSYVLNGYQGNNFRILANCSKPWGGVNSVDALQILKHFVGQSPLTGLFYQAADVNGSGSINSLDGLSNTKRFVNQISSFVVGDWTFDKPIIQILEGNPQIIPMKGICIGDVNGSYVPPQN